MSASFRPTTCADEEQLRAFLARVFSADAGSAFLNPALVRWKFWMERDDFPGPRSYILERGGKIAAHAGLWPMILRTGSREQVGVQMIDWASDPKSPGSGAAVVQRLLKMFDFVFSIGGGHKTRTILPALGFRQVGNAWIAARPLRPVRQMFEHQHANWKLPARLARNAWWASVPAVRDLAEWNAVPISPGAIRLPETSPEIQPSLRSAAFFRYAQSCPGARIVTFQISRKRQPEGILVLSSVQKQARVVGVWLERPSRETLAAAYGLAQREARRLNDVCEIAASGSSSVSETAAKQSGLRVCDRVPVYLHSRYSRCPELPSELQFADSDSFFLGGDAPEFLT